MFTNPLPAWADNLQAIREKARADTERIQTEAVEEAVEDSELEA